MNNQEYSIERDLQRKRPTAPRLTPDQIDSVISHTQYYVFPETTVTVCCITLLNGYSVIGESAAVSQENFDSKIGEKVSYENARQKIWALEGYLLKELLFRS